MLNSEACWSPNITDGNQWMTIDLGSVKTVCEIITQGRNSKNQFNAWVTSYKLSYSEDGSFFILFNDGMDLPGNHDCNGRAKHDVDFQAQYVRFLPSQWFNGI